VPPAGDRSVARSMRCRYSDRSLDVGRSHAGLTCLFGTISDAWHGSQPCPRHAASSSRPSARRPFARSRAVLSKDRAGLLRDLANPANVRHLARSAIRHPAVTELANAGLVFQPGRNLPLGWAATWATRRVLRRYLDPPVEVREGTRIEAGPLPMIVTPAGSETERGQEGPR
jgi:hypothetical protein